MSDGIIQLDKFRTQKAEDKKRKTERIFFKHLIGIYGVMPGERMIPVELVDISEDGLGFQIKHREEKIWPHETENQRFRMYFSPESYMEITVDIRNSRPVIDGGTRYVRYGAAVREDQKTFGAWKQFVGFLRLYSEVSERDAGNMGVSGY